jgi:hypothetical protein
MPFVCKKKVSKARPVRKVKKARAKAKPRPRQPIAHKITDGMKFLQLKLDEWGYETKWDERYNKLYADISSEFPIPYGSHKFMAVFQQSRDNKDHVEFYIRRNEMSGLLRNINSREIETYFELQLSNPDCFGKLQSIFYAFFLGAMAMRKNITSFLGEGK